jgi:hypothetical protein
VGGKGGEKKKRELKESEMKNKREWERERKKGEKRGEKRKEKKGACRKLVKTTAFCFSSNL